MIGTKVETKWEPAQLLRAEKLAAFKSFFQAAFAIMKTAKSSIQKSEGPSPEGDPPHTHNRQFIRRAIRYSADRDGATIGTAFSAIGTVGEAHEFGGEYRGSTFPERPFMQPALNANLDLFQKGWDGSVNSTF